MSGKKQRRRNLKAKAWRARGTPSGQEQSVRQLASSLDRAVSALARYADSSDDPSGMVAAARSDVASLSSRVVEAACGLDVITAVSSVRVEMAMRHSATGEDIPAAILELIALILTCRDTEEHPSVPRPEEYLPNNLFEAGREVMSLGGLIPMLEHRDNSSESAIVFASIQREVLLRNPVYPHMLLETLHGLFGDEAVEADCRAVLGFSGVEAVEIMSAVGSRMRLGVAGLFERLFAARDSLAPYLRRHHRHGNEELPADGVAALSEFYDAMTAITTDIAEATCVDSRAVALETGLPSTTVEKVLDAFTLRGLTDRASVLDRFLHGDNPLRTAPILVDGDGRRMIVHEALALPAVREVIETSLKQAGRINAYEHHRGTYVETTAVDLVAGFFPGAKVYRGFNYFIPAPDAATPQQSPEAFTKRVEGDGLVLIDDVALIVEVKAVAMTAEARGGVARRLTGKLRDIITKATDQAGRLRDRILLDQRIRLDNDEWIDVSHIREVHTIAVGLEDLSGVTTATFLLVAAGVLPPDHIPWTISVHDLRIVTEVLERPSELLLYLRRRTQPEATWRYRAVDEIDLLMTYLRRGLYVERDPAEVTAEQPWIGPPSTADVRRFARQWPEIIEGETGQLDAWYETQTDPKARSSSKPRFGAAESKLLDLVDQVSDLQEPGWLRTATALLEGDSKTQRACGFHATDLARLTRSDGKHHSITAAMRDSQHQRTLLVWAVPGRKESLDDLITRLYTYLRAKKHQTQSDLAACMIFDRKTRTLVKLLYLNTTDKYQHLLGNLQPLSKPRTPARIARRATS